MEYQNQIECLIHTAEIQLFSYPCMNPADKMKYYIKRMIRRKNVPVINHYGWPNALLANALAEAEKKDLIASDVLEKYYAAWNKSGLRMQSIDNAMNGYALLSLYEKNPKPEYKQILDRIYLFISNYPLNINGSFPYNKKQLQDVYVDGIGTVVPFLCRYGKVFHRNAAIDMGIRQIDNFMQYGMDKKSGLPYQGFDAVTEIKYGIIGWGRSVGWLMLGIVDSLEYIENQDNYDRLAVYLKELIVTVVEYQLENGYFTWQLQAMEGPVDTSATAMIGYAVQKAVRIGVSDKAYLKYVDKAIEAIIHSTKENNVFDCSGECIGFGQYPQWNYGAYPWSLGPTLLLLL